MSRLAEFKDRGAVEARVAEGGAAVVGTGMETIVENDGRGGMEIVAAGVDVEAVVDVVTVGVAEADVVEGADMIATRSVGKLRKPRKPRTALLLLLLLPLLLRQRPNRKGMFPSSTCTTSQLTHSIEPPKPQLPHQPQRARSVQHQKTVRQPAMQRKPRRTGPRNHEHRRRACMEKKKQI